MPGVMVARDTLGANLLVSMVFEPTPDWEETLRRTGSDAGFCQSEIWARILKGVTQAKPIFLTARDSVGESAGQLLVFVQKPFHRARRRMLGRMQAAVQFAPTVLHWLDGPVVHRRSERVATTAVLLDAVNGIARKYRVDTISGTISAATSHMVGDLAVKAEFLRLGYSLHPWATFLVDLTPSEELLWRSIDHSARKGVRKCERLGVRVREIFGFEDFMSSFYKPYRMTEETYGRSVNPAYFAEVTFSEDRVGVYRYFVAEDPDGSILATLGMYTFNGIATEIASALTPAAYRAKIPAQDLLHWKMFLSAKSTGCETFNLAGVSPHPQDDKEQGIRRFKEKWGGRYVEYDRVERRFGLWQSLASVRAVAAKLRARLR